jgi:hypothetical protein
LSVVVILLFLPAGGAYHPSQYGAACSTSKPTYIYGETVTLIITPLSGITSYYVVIYKPDGSTTKIDLGDLEGPYPPAPTYYFDIGEAGPPPGTRRVVLYEWDGSQQAECYYEVVGGGPADIAVPSCWVSPSSPHQEDSVTFYAEVDNIGGSDAPNVEIDAYLDGTLFRSERASIPASTSATWRSDSPWVAEDGSHTLRVVANADHSVEESDYRNNEASCSFFVSPRTITVTLTVTKTSTRTQTQRTVETITSTRTLTATRTTDTTVLQTITAIPSTLTRTLTGLVTSTAYSPTVTVTVTASAQMISNSILWLALGTFAVIGAAFQPPKKQRLGRFYRRLTDLLPLQEFLAWLGKRHARKALITLCLVSVIVLSVSSQVTEQAFGSTVTTTRTVTSTQWTTLTQSLTSTRYITSTATDTSTITNTQVRYTTITPTITQTTDERSTTTAFATTTTTVTIQSNYEIAISSRVYYDPFRREIVDLQGTVMKNGNQFDIELMLKNKREGFYQVKVYRGPVYFQPQSLAYENVLWPEQTLYPARVWTPEFGDGSQICVDVELQITLEAIVFAVDVILPVPVDVVSYGQNIVWLKSELTSHMISQGYLRSDYESKPDAREFLTKFSDLCGKEPKYVVSTLAEFAKSCYITLEMDGLESAIESFASKWLLPFKLLQWDIHVWQTPATEIVYVDIRKT